MVLRTCTAHMHCAHWGGRIVFIISAINFSDGRYHMYSVELSHTEMNVFNIIKTQQIFYLVFLSIFQLISSHQKLGCTPCGPGTRVKQNCNEQSDTVCIPCEKGHYSETSDYLHHCEPCPTIENCYTGQILVGDCTPIKKNASCICPEENYLNVAHKCKPCHPPCEPGFNETQPCLPEPENMNRKCSKNPNNDPDDSFLKCYCGENEICLNSTSTTECLCKEPFFRDCDNRCKPCDKKTFKCMLEYFDVCEKPPTTPQTARITTPLTQLLHKITASSKTTLISKPADSGNVYLNSNVGISIATLFFVVIFLFVIGLIFYKKQKCKLCRVRPPCDNPNHISRRSFSDRNTSSLLDSDITHGHQRTLSSLAYKVLDDNSIKRLTHHTNNFNDDPEKRYDRLKTWTSHGNNFTFREIRNITKETSCQDCLIEIAKRHWQDLDETQDTEHQILMP